MAENREINFAFTIKEAVGWGFEHISDTNFLYFPEEKVYERLDRMRSWGWSPRKILKRCSVNHGTENTVSIIHIVQNDHPILSEWDDVDIRLALFDANVDAISWNRKHILISDVIEGRMHPDDKERFERYIRGREEVNRKLFETLTPTHEIRNR
jgi:hypothetical protein